MTGQPRIIIAVPPEFSNTAGAQISGASDFSCQTAHMIYRIGRGFRLYRARNASVRGGYMVLDTSAYRGGGPISVLVSDILEECGGMGYSGIALDTGTDKGSQSQRLLSRALAAAAHKAGLDYFVPQTFSDSGDNAIVRIPTALSGGTLCRHLSEAVNKYSVKRVAVEIERIRMDFTLPSRSGVGRELTPEALRGLLENHNARPVYSPDLAVNYFTYSNKKGAHFVLYDDEMSINNKLSAAAALGIEYAFLYYPQVADILKSMQHRSEDI